MAQFKSKTYPHVFGVYTERYDDKKKPVYARVIDGEYPAAGNDGTKRMVKDEQNKVMLMLAMCALTAEIQKGLEHRLNNVPRGMARIKQIRSGIVRLTFDLLNTAPLEQREQIERQTKGLAVFAGVRGEGPINPDQEFGYFITRNQFEIMVGAIREQCDLCTIEDPGEQAKCKYARLLNALPIDKENEDAKGCGWFHTWSM